MILTPQEIDKLNQINRDIDLHMDRVKELQCKHAQAQRDLIRLLSERDSIRAKVTRREAQQ